MKWLRRFFAVIVHRRRVREFNRTTKGTQIASSWKSASAIYDYGGNEALNQVMTRMMELRRQEEDILARVHDSTKR